MATGRTVKVIIDVVAPNGAEKAKKPIRDLEAEVKRSQKAIEAEHKRTAAAIEKSEKTLSAVQQKEAKRRANEFIATLREQQQAQKAHAVATAEAWSTAFGAVGFAASTVAVALTAVAAVMGKVVAESVKAAISFEQTTNALTALAGSAGVARVQLQKIQETSLKTPGLSLETAEKGLQRLRAVGFEAQQAERMLVGLSKVRLLSGAQKEDVDAVIYNLTQIRSMGRLTGDELRESLGRIPALGKVFEDAFGTRSSEAIAKLGLSSDQFFKLLIGALERTKGATGGTQDAWEKFNDTLTIAKRQLGAPILAPLTKSLIILTKSFDGSESTIVRWGNAFARTVEFVNSIAQTKFPAIAYEFIKAFAPVVNILDSVNKLMIAFESITGGVSGIARGTVDRVEYEADIARSLNGGRKTLGKSNRLINIAGSLGGGGLVAPSPFIVSGGGTTKPQSIRGGGSRSGSLATAGLSEFADNRTKARYAQALRNLSPGLRAQIVKFAEMYGIPESLALAQIYSESSFNTQAVSPFNKNVGSSAFGLTQQLPQTASRMIGRRVTGEELKANPELALTAWGRYMSKLFAEFGDWELATLAYHQGEGNVRQLVKLLDAGKSTADFFAKRPNGTAYVKKIAALSGIRGNQQFQAARSNPFASLSPATGGGLISTESGEIQQPFARRLSEQEKYVERLRQELNISERITQQILRQSVEQEEIQVLVDDQTLAFREQLDVLLRQGEAFRRMRQDPAAAGTSLQVQSESERNQLDRDIASLQDQITNFQTNSAQRISLAAEQDRLDLLKREEEAIMRVNRAYLDLTNKGAYSANEANARVLEYLNNQIPSVTDAVSDFKITIADSVFQQMAQPFDWLKSKLEKLPPILKGVTSAFLDLGQSILKALSQGFIMRLLGLGGTGQSGGFGGLLGGLLGGGGAIGGTAGFNPMSLVPGVGGVLGLSGLIGGGATTAAAGTAATAGTVAGGGGAFAGLGALFTNPWTIGIGAAIGGGLLLWKLFGSNDEKKLKKAAKAAFGVDIKDKGVLKQLKRIGEAAFGKGQAGKRADEVVQLQDARDLIEGYAEQTRQKTDKLAEKDFTNENWSGNQYGMAFSGFGGGGSPTSSNVPSTSGASSSGVMAAVVAATVMMTEAVEKFNEKFGAASAGDIIVANAPAVGKALQIEGELPTFNESLGRAQGLYI